MIAIDIGKYFVIFNTMVMHKCRNCSFSYMPRLNVKSSRESRHIMHRRSIKPLKFEQILIVRV